MPSLLGVNLLTLDVTDIFSPNVPLTKTDIDTYANFLKEIQNEMYLIDPNGEWAVDDPDWDYQQKVLNPTIKDVLVAKQLDHLSKRYIAPNITIPTNIMFYRHPIPYTITFMLHNAM